MIKKIIQTILILCCIMGISNGAILYDSFNNPEYVTGLNEDNLFNVDYSLAFINSNSSYTVNQGIYTRLNTYRQYYIINNNDVSVPFEFTINYKTANDITQNITRLINVSGGNSLILWVVPDYDTESLQVYARCRSEEVDSIDSLECGAGYEVREFTYSEQQTTQVNTIFAPLINAVVDLIIINVSIWKILYYLFITSLVIGSITGLVLLGKKFYDYAKSHNIYKHHNHR